MGLYFVDIRYRKATKDMDQRYPFASTEQLENVGHTCVVCRLDMQTGRVFPCGHIFHHNCIIGWFQNSQTCPLCRSSALIEEMEPEQIRFYAPAYAYLAGANNQQARFAPQNNGNANFQPAGQNNANNNQRNMQPPANIQPAAQNNANNNRQNIQPPGPNIQNAMANIQRMNQANQANNNNTESQTELLERVDILQELIETNQMQLDVMREQLNYLRTSIQQTNN